MIKYYNLNNYSRNGSLNISLDVFNQITKYSVLKYLKENNLDKDKVKLSQNIKSSKTSDGQVKINISLDLKKDYCNSKLCLDIQKKVSDGINLFLEVIPLKVEVNLSKII